ncbi:radical SAM/Cys-rich domain protein [bacterium]|nr:MAG: radical SAM/Cys-rich domain protein [bacterium]
MNEFDPTAGGEKNPGVFADGIKVLQVNVGLRCNLSCSHCHLESGPERHESMSWEVMEKIVGTAKTIEGVSVDITGGSPELNVHLERFITALSENKIPVKLRTNLAALMGRERLCGFLARSKVSLVASLPCYLKENVDAQRGKGTFDASVLALHALNSLGYGKTLPLTLVYNPSGPFLPPPQTALEEAYRRRLREDYGVEFTNLITITNMPIGRFFQSLDGSGQAAGYLSKLKESFNPKTVSGLMCRSQITIGWDGVLYDCDFNIALGLPVGCAGSRTIGDFSPGELNKRRIVTGNHCFGCTAGQGSSCAGALD